VNVLDLFSGIGGFSLGLEATGKFKTIAFCEKDEFCRKVLKKHWPNVKQYNDIRSINGTKISADIISGGFPCQPFSVAGKRKGTTDDRYLWDEMLRVITEVKPRWIIAENVQGIINIDNGLVLRQVQTDLEAQGFQVQCFLIPASGIGAWHRRNRVWIIANSNPRLSIGENQEIQARGNTIDSSSSDVSNSNSNFERQQTWWQTQSSFCGVPNGISYELDKGRTNRIKSLGNAIVPQIAFEIGKAILAAEEKK